MRGPDGVEIWTVADRATDEKVGDQGRRQCARQLAALIGGL